MIYKKLIKNCQLLRWGLEHLGQGFGAPGLGFGGWIGKLGGSEAILAGFALPPSLGMLDLFYSIC